MYSSRTSLESGRGFRLFVLFIVLSLNRRGLSSADDSRPAVRFGEAHDEQSLPCRVADDEFPSFVIRMIRIVENAGEKNPIASASANGYPSKRVLLVKQIGRHDPHPRHARRLGGVA